MDKSERCHTENHDVPLPEPEHITTQRQTLPDAFCGEKLVRPERFELPTYSSGGCRSIQLSYGRAADSSSVHCSHGTSQRLVAIPVETRLAASPGCSIAGDGASPVSTTISTSCGQPSTAAIEPRLRLFDCRTFLR